MTSSWEYKVITLTKGSGLFSSPMKNDEEITRAINHEGAQGWELVTAVGVTAYTPLKLFFKRPR